MAIIVLVAILGYVSLMFFPHVVGGATILLERKFPVVCQIINFYDKTNVYNCLSTVSVDTNNVGMCKSLDSYHKDRCLPSIAWRTGDANLCTGLTDDRRIQSCLVGATSNNRYKLEFCGLFTDQNKKDQCYKYIGTQKHDNTVCGYILDNMEQSSCYEENANYGGDSNMCQQIKDSKLMGLCYYRLAVSSKKPQACNDLHDEYSNTYLKDNCLLDVAISAGDMVAKEKICLAFNSKPRDSVINRSCQDVRGYIPVK